MQKESLEGYNHLGGNFDWEERPEEKELGFEDALRGTIKGGWADSSASC